MRGRRGGGYREERDPRDVRPKGVVRNEDAVKDNINGEKVNTKSKDVPRVTGSASEATSKKAAKSKSKTKTNPKTSTRRVA